MSKNCLILRGISTQSVNIATISYNYANRNYNFIPSVISYQDVTAQLQNTNLLNASRWTITDNCERFARDNQFYYRPSIYQTTYRVGSGTGTFNPLAFSPDVNVAVDSTSVWLLDTTNFTFYKAFDNPVPILPNANVAVFDNNRIVITATSQISAQVFVYFKEITGAFTNCLTFTFSGYVTAPKIWVSPQLTKVLIMGPIVSTTAIPQPKYDAFTIDYNTRSTKNVSFDFSTIPDPVNTFAILEDKYLYIRSLNVPTVVNTNTTVTPTAQENVYYIDQDITSQLAKSTILTQGNINSWRATVVTPSVDGNLTILVE